MVIYKDKFHVDAQEVNLLKVEGSKTYVTGGLKEGDLIISKNQILIYNSLTED